MSCRILLAKATAGYLGNELASLAKDVALWLILSELGPEQVQHLTANKTRNIKMKDFEDSLMCIKASVNPATLDVYTMLNKYFCDTTAF